MVRALTGTDWQWLAIHVSELRHPTGYVDALVDLRLMEEVWS